MSARNEFIAKWVFDSKGFVIGTERKGDLIRCWDCKYAIDEYGDGHCYCRNGREMLRYIGEDWNHYCSFAERKEEVHEEDIWDE